MNRLIQFSVLMLGLNGCFVSSLAAMQVDAKVLPSGVGFAKPGVSDSVTFNPLVRQIQIHQRYESRGQYHRVNSWRKPEASPIAEDSGRTVVVSTAVGAIAGALVGGTIGRKFATGNCELTYPPCDNATRGTVVGAGLGAIAGGVIGYLVGVVLRDR